MEMIPNDCITWAEARQIVNVRNISEQQFRDWYKSKDYSESYQNLLELIVHHVYHSTSEKLIAPLHLLQTFLEDYRRE